MRKAVVAAGAVLLAAGAAAAQATGSDPKIVQAVRRAISTMTPQTRVARPDHERLTARRIDVVDSKGVIRMTLAGETPNPIVDGIEYKRSVAPLGGLIIWDENGDERGGIGFNPGSSRTQLSFDYSAQEAVAVVAGEDGTSEIIMKSLAPETRLPEFGSRRLPLSVGQERLRVRVRPSGEPEIILADAQERPRVRLAVTSEGYGALEFLDANGRVVSSLVPERDRAAGG